MHRAVKKTANYFQKSARKLNFRALSACQKSPVSTFLTALTAERFEFFQNAASPKKLVKSSFLAADYCNARRAFSRCGSVTLRL